jgi:hypothetical protein
VLAELRDFDFEMGLFAAENKFGAPRLVTAPALLGARLRLQEPPTIQHLSMSIPAPSASAHSLDGDDGVEVAPFPAPSRQAAGLVNGTQTDVSSVYFADKILITVSQSGRLSQWVCSHS